MKERIKEIKRRLERNKKWQTQTEGGYVPSVVGEYKHEDIAWLIEKVIGLDKYNDTLQEKIIQYEKDIEELDKTLHIARVGRKGLTAYVKQLKDEVEKLKNELTGYKLSNQSLSNALEKEINEK